MVFTDGSVWPSPVGCGACAAVLVPLFGEDEHHDSKPVGERVTSVTCELEGIVLALELCVNYFSVCKQRKSKEYVYIFCDCTAAIDVIVRRPGTARIDLFRRLVHLEDLLADMMVNIVLVWIPAHHGISFHDIADGLARTTVRDIFNGKLSAPCDITYYDAIKVAADIAMNSWQVKWNQDVTGYYTRWLIPEVGTKVLFPEKRNIGVSYCRLLLHDTMLREDSYRTGTADSPVCQCGLGTESAEHYLLYCTRFQEARHKLLDKLADFYESTSSNKRLQLSEELLLAPKTDLVTRKHNFWIKDALFEFIADTHVKL